MSATATAAKNKERPIIFSGPMVKAILEGRKTQTRRVVTDAPEAATALRLNSMGHYLESHLAELREWVPVVGRHGCETMVRCPYGNKGDRLWVRETWATGFNKKFHDDHGVSAPDYLVDPHTREPLIVFAADHQFPMMINEEFMAEHDHIAWKSPIHMRRAASRVTLKVTNIRVERVQSISEEDAIAEGLQRSERTGMYPSPQGNCEFATWAYRYAWDSLNAKRGYSWESNPWVWVIEFKKL